jgi:integrase
MVMTVMSDALWYGKAEAVEPAATPEESAGDRRKAEHLARVRQALERKEDAPFRHLAMPDLGAVTDITLAEFDELRGRVVGCKELTAIPKSGTLAETICRACHLLFALVESGGLCMPHPERAAEDLIIDLRGGFGGYLRWPERRRESGTGKGKRAAAGDEGGGEDAAPRVGFAGPRQHLYALGHTHLMAFVRYRLRRDRARDGDLLLPCLPGSTGDLKRKVTGSLPWLESFKGKAEWRRIFRHWLNTQLSEVRGGAAEVSWVSVVQLALWRILRHERRALLLATRRNLITTSPLPDDKVNDLLAYRQISYCKVDRKGRITMDDHAVESNPRASRAEYARLGPEQTEAALLDLDEGVPEGAIESKRDADRRRVNVFISGLRAGEVNKAEVIKAAKALAESHELSCAVDDDLRYLLRWIGTLLRKKREVSTAHTYASRVVRALHAFDDKPLSACTTDDIAAYLENYETPSSVRNVRGTLEDFDDYLIASKGATPDRVKWHDKSLLAYEQYRERDCLTEDEYRRVRERVISNVSDKRLCLRDLSLLTLLRRCGLRADEAAWLTVENFLGWTQWRLLVVRSKTRAGRKRALPLYLLLDDEEQRELRRYVELRRADGGRGGLLFVEPSGERTRAHALGREAEALLRNGGVRGETAHGLRHAFATGLFAAWWLAMREGGDAPARKGGWARHALEMYGRPGVESRAVSHAYHIQLMLGHADLRVTFDRYVHVLDLACADAVWMAENLHGYGHDDRMRLTHAARLIGTDERDLRAAIPESQRRNAVLALPSIRTFLRGRIIELT